MPGGYFRQSWGQYRRLVRQEQSNCEVSVHLFARGVATRNQIKRICLAGSSHKGLNLSDRGRRDGRHYGNPHVLLGTGLVISGRGPCLTL